MWWHLKKLPSAWYSEAFPNDQCLNRGIYVWTMATMHSRRWMTTTLLTKPTLQKMLSEYCNRSCKSHTLDKKIASTKAYAKHRNKFIVTCHGVSTFSPDARKHHLSYQTVLEIIKKALKSCFELLKNESLSDALFRIATSQRERSRHSSSTSGTPWYARRRTILKQCYFLLHFKRLFKNSNFMPVVVAAAYMMGRQSPLGDF